jgi:hypothetical protein
VYPITGDRSYTSNCYGHDEPMLDPISSTAGTGQDITWTFTLPKSSKTRSLVDLGPTFWIGATLGDSSSVSNSVFSELQFYPDSTLLPQKGTNLNTACSPQGFNVKPLPGTWSVCDFTWGLYGATPAQWQETPAYVSVLDTSTNASKPLYLHSGDTISVHVFPSGDKNNDAEQTLTDLTTKQSGSLNMLSNATTGAGSAAHPGVGDGPLTLPYSTNTTSNMMPWGAVAGTPFAFSWEIGHSNFYTHPTQPECVPGQWDCFSYDIASDGWSAITPVEIKSVTFKVGSKIVKPSSFATNDGQGGAGEDSLWCGAYNPKGSINCGFPWYTYSTTTKGIALGTNYPGTTGYQYGLAKGEYTQTQTCTGPLTGPYGFKYFCDTTLNPKPPIS